LGWCTTEGDQKGDVDPLGHGKKEKGKEGKEQSESLTIQGGGITCPPTTPCGLERKGDITPARPRKEKKKKKGAKAQKPVQEHAEDAHGHTRKEVIGKGFIKEKRKRGGGNFLEIGKGILTNKGETKLFQERGRKRLVARAGGKQCPAWGVSGG